MPPPRPPSQRSNTRLGFSPGTSSVNARSSYSPTSIQLSPDRTSAPVYPTPTPSSDERKTRINAKRQEKSYNSREDNIAWLDHVWGGADWLPPDVRKALIEFGFPQPAVDVVKHMRSITELMQTQGMALDSLWADGGPLREGVNADVARKQHKRRQDGPAPPHLSAAIAKNVLESLQQQDTSSPAATQDMPDPQEPEEEEVTTDSFADAEDYVSEPDDNVVLLVETAGASEIQDLTSPAAKKRPPTPANEPVFTGALKRFRTLSSYTADRLLDCLTPGNQMGDDALQVLCEVAMAHHRQKHRPSRLFHPFWFQSQEAFQPRSFPRLDDGCTAGFPIHCPKPWESLEHWAFGVMTPKGENLQLRIHDSAPTPERYERIKKRFEAWMDVSSYSGDVEFIKESCPRQNDAWSCGLHAVACFRRVLQGIPCSENPTLDIPVEQAHHLSLLRTIDTRLLPTDVGNTIETFRSVQREADLRRLSADEILRLRDESISRLQKAEMERVIGDQALDKSLEAFLAHVRQQKAENERKVQEERARFDTLNRIYKVREDYERKVKAEAEKNRIQEEVRKAEEMLKVARSKLDDASVKHNASVTKFQESFASAEAEDWEVNLEGVSKMWEHSKDR
ncbi:uncharacterized protein NECHADRAFT_82506 [Fusarium vanettenii 77-13-4]|uniref:Ubiquitin-like protease family profile domain-containing protein n=1 Tax=Fusarium vanettenii (strain ATCC MYA-4622 / CBS 123669 / FGSC 9596 / NRRL 45880 / 77-13-4) TaxID=660122 RepID=C7YXF0_FUSV7|nr:uncharacterized protein NECHADRAFT_82506 [Fusarium vanettenii 77-13-4]EEU43577.1 predicted protein [Fusarium vanettenii 77-13-4]